MDENRVKHSLAVAKKMVELAKENGMSLEEQNICFVIGLNHDIGYQYTNDYTCHNIVGGNFLKDIGFKYWKEIYFHGFLEPEYNSTYLWLLNKADMQIDRYGNDVGYEGRLKDIAARHGSNSDSYKRCYKLIQILNGKD